MTITNQSANYITVTLANEEVLDTQRATSGRVQRKFFATSFQGSGTLEASDNKTNWISSGKSENETIDLQDTLPRYIRINGTAGDKTVHLVAL